MNAAKPSEPLVKRLSFFPPPGEPENLLLVPYFSGLARVNLFWESRLPASEVVDPAAEAFASHP
ncbi:MAG TPA: hypothetical protein VNT79_16990, partial [Phycisphaerae bacterium]|nr:hypothetical protein [Phycisphaerae bacterium]